MKITRYYPVYECTGYPFDMGYDPEGDWVKWEDVEPLLERIKELEEQLEFERSLEDKI